MPCAAPGIAGSLSYCFGVNNRMHFIILGRSSKVTEGESMLPAVFVYGDSQIDNLSLVLSPLLAKAWPRHCIRPTLASKCPICLWPLHGQPHPGQHSPIKTGSLFLSQSKPRSTSPSLSLRLLILTRHEPQIRIYLAPVLPWGHPSQPGPSGTLSPPLYLG